MCIPRDSADEGRLAAREAALTREVPALLDAMNGAASEANALERQVGQAQERWGKLLEEGRRAYEEMRTKFGAADVDRARPFFDAAQRDDSTTRRLRLAARELAAVAAEQQEAQLELGVFNERLAYGAHQVVLEEGEQDGLSRATVRVLRLQQERDRREQEHARARGEHHDAQHLLGACRAQVSDSVIRRTLPSFRQLQQNQLLAASEQTRIDALAGRARAARKVYDDSLRELNRISGAVHAARREHEHTLMAIQVFSDEPTDRTPKVVRKAPLERMAVVEVAANWPKGAAALGVAAGRAVVAADDSPFA